MDGVTCAGDESLVHSMALSSSVKVPQVVANSPLASSITRWKRRVRGTPVKLIAGIGVADIIKKWKSGTKLKPWSTDLIIDADSGCQEGESGVVKRTWGSGKANVLVVDSSEVLAMAGIQPHHPLCI